MPDYGLGHSTGINYIGRDAIGFGDSRFRYLLLFRGRGWRVDVVGRGRVLFHRGGLDGLRGLDRWVSHAG